MASSSPLLLLLSLYAFCLSPSAAQRPKALVLPVSKDPSTLQYVLRLHQRTPLVPLRLSLDLGGRHLWVDCEDSSYSSSTYRPVRCRTAQCAAGGKGTACSTCSSSPARPGCNSDTCSVNPENPFTRVSTSGEVAEDVVSVSATDGSNPGPAAVVKKFLFACGSTFLLDGLAPGVKGVAGLGRTQIAPPSQFAAAFSFPRKFAICLTSAGVDGVVFFGDGPYRLLPGPVVSEGLIYTPLLTNPVSNAGTSVAGEPSYEYFIGVKSIRVNNNPVPINATLLSIDRGSGVGGTKISTAVPYTVLEASIYKAVVEAFARESGLKRVAPVSPFGACFDGTNVGSTRVGPAVPAIDLMLQSESVVWRIFGANSMVYVKTGVLCLGFVDGGKEPRTSIVIGGHQLENNLLQFDLAASRLGFSSSLLFRQTTCANFNFTSSA